MNAKRPKKIDVIKKQALKVGYITILSTILFLGISYAWLSLTLSGTKTNVLRVGTLSLVLDDTIGEGIAIDKGLPIVDEEGLTQIPYIFTLTNNGDIESEYTIYLDDVDLLAGETRLPDHAIKYSLLRDGSELGLDLLSTTGENPNRILDTGIIQPKETYTYELRLWLDINAGNDTMGQVFRGKIRVEATQVVEPIPTESGCFVYTKSGNAVTITNYKCYEGNPDGMPVITDVAIPRLIEGLEVKSIGWNAFGSKGLTSVNIPRTVTSLGNSSFQYNNLTTVDIPQSVTEIGSNAFDHNQLVSVEIPRSVKTLRGFSNNQIASIKLPDGMTMIDGWSLSTNQLTNLKIPDSVTTIGSGAFYKNNLTNVKFPKGLTKIDTYVFQYNQLENIQIPETVTYIGNSAFANNKLTGVTLPNGLEHLEGFQSNQITNIKIPDGVTYLAGFSGNKITSVVIPNSVTTLGGFGSNQLTSVIIPNSVTEILGWSFDSNQLTNIIIPASVANIGDGSFKSNRLTNVTIKGKSSTADFVSYPTSSPFGWASGYSDSNITWNG